MKIVKVEHFRADGGIKPLCFLKLSADDGSVGWSEYSELLGGAGLGALIAGMSAALIGTDPRDTARLTQRLLAQTRSAGGGLNAQATAALENACLDLKARALGVPVHELFGGALRDRLPCYWSHFGMHRARAAHQLGKPPLHGIDDLAAMTGEAAALGYRAIKTNVMRFDAGQAQVVMPGFGRGPGGPELNLDDAMLTAIVAQMSALRDAAGSGIGLALDLNFNFKPSGVRRIAQALEPLGLIWLETDLPDPAALAAIRQCTRTPIASLETALHRRQALPFLAAQAVDLAIIDVMWCGMSEAVHLAGLADAYDVNINSHVFSSPLAAAMAAQLCALAPNFHLMELDVDAPPWLDGLFDQPLKVEGGVLCLPDGPGWGITPNEATLRAAPSTLG